MVRNERFLRREYLKALIPVMFSVLAGTVNTLIDSAFVVRRLGSDALAAINMCGPLYQIVCTVGCLLAGGASVLSAQREGENNSREGRQYFYTASAYCILTGLFAGVVGFIFCRPISSFLAQGGNLTEYVYGYAQVAFLGFVPVAFAYIPLYYLQLEGRRKEMIRMMEIVIFSDIALDWVFLYIFPFRTRGAAAASVLSMLLACVYGMAQLGKVDASYRLRAEGLKNGKWKEILAYGSPGALGNLLDAVKLLLLNALILKVGGNQAAAVWAVLNSLSELSLSIVGGIPQAAAPMIGVFYSAKENSGIRILMRLQLQMGILFLAAFNLVLLVFHNGIREFFELSQPVLFPLVCLGASMVFELVCGVWGSCFNDTDQITLSNILMGFRCFVFPVGTAYLLAWAGGYLWLFLVLAPLLSLAVLLAITGKLSAESRRTAHRRSRYLLLDDYLEENGYVLDFSIDPTEEAICEASDRIGSFCIKNHMDQKKINRMRLAIEELLVVMTQKNPKMASIDVGLFVEDGHAGIRIRSAGEEYNPFQAAEGTEDEFYLGVTMLKKMAKEVTHSYTMGMNSIYLDFGGIGQEGQ